MSHHKLFNDKSAHYAKVRPCYPQELYTFLESQCHEHKNAWDVACGNGQAAVDLAQHFDIVEATDISEEQIAHAISNPRINYSILPAERTDFAKNHFELVCVAQALHWFDHEFFWKEVKRVLKPDGIFAAWGYSWFYISDETDQVINTHFLEAIKPYWAPQNKLLWNHYKDIPFPFEKVNTPKIGMKVIWDLEQLFAYLQSWSAAKLCVKEKGDGFLNNTYENLKSVWGDEKKRKVVEMDFSLLVGKNQKEII